MDDLNIAEFPNWEKKTSLPDDREIYEWAKQHLVLPATYAIPGPFNVEKSRYMIKPFQAVKDFETREISVAASIQTAKTLFVEIAIAWVIKNDPGPIMWTMQTDEDANEQWETRFFEMLKKCVPVANLLPSDRTKLKTSNINFGNFFLLLNGANLSNLQSKSIRWKFNSEVWLWKAGLLEHARGRVSAFEEIGSSKVVNESQGGIEDDDMDQAFKAGNQSIWGIPDPDTGNLNPLGYSIDQNTGKVVPFQYSKDNKEGEENKLGGIVWNMDAKRDDGSWSITRACETAHYVHPSGYEDSDTDRTRSHWNKEGDYVVTNPDAVHEKKSFRWNSLTKRSLAKIVEQYLRAKELELKGKIEPMAEFLQKRWALSTSEETFQEKIELVTSNYTSEIYANGEIWPGETKRFLTIDRQLNHYWAVVRAWKPNMDSRRLYWSKVMTEEQLILIEKRYKIQPGHTFQDAQYEPGEVYRECSDNGWYALHGDDRKRGYPHKAGKGLMIYKPHSPQQSARTKHGKLCKYYFWDNNAIKDQLAMLIAGRGAKWEMPSDADEQYLKGLNSEEKQQVNANTWRWIRVIKNNHPWDCESMQIVACLLYGIFDFRKLMEHTPDEKPEEESEEDKKQEKQPTERKKQWKLPRQNKSFVQGWR